MFIVSFLVGAFLLFSANSAPIFSARKKEINDIYDALLHYISNASGVVPAGPGLYQEIKLSKSFEKQFGANGEVTNIIRGKIIHALKTGQKRISSAPDSHRGLRCFTLGSYSVKIKYDYSNIKNGTNIIPLTLSGYDDWDFKYNQNYTKIQNLLDEKIPGMIADFGLSGGGTPFRITYEFQYPLTVDIK